MEQVFNAYNQKIRVYFSKEEIVDPYEKNVELTTLYSQPLKAIVSDLSFASIQWKIPGISTNKAKEIIIEKKNKSIIELSEYIEIGEERYLGWRINGKMQSRDEGNFTRCYIYLSEEQVNES